MFTNDKTNLLNKRNSESMLVSGGEDIPGLFSELTNLPHFEVGKKVVTPVRKPSSPLRGRNKSHSTYKIMPNLF